MSYTPIINDIDQKNAYNCKLFYSIHLYYLSSPFKCMLQLQDISKLGFGTYRTSVGSNEHARALHHAVNLGCNLIDTASNYENGNSEILVGEAIKHFKNKDLFVITKAGYINTSNLEVLRTLNKDGLGKEGLVELSEDFKHSINPDYLNAQLSISLNRLNRKFVDGFLLHSPEYYFDERNNTNRTREEYYERIQLAFEFLEEKVSSGVIRYYGLSSNSLTLGGNAFNATDLSRINDIALKVNSNNHFKLVQFPYNIIENNAKIANEPRKETLIEFAKLNNLITIANRPLMVNTSIGVIKMVYSTLPLLDFESDAKLASKCFEIIRQQMTKAYGSSDISEYSLLVFLEENWMNLKNMASVDKLFRGVFYPFVELIYDKSIPKSDEKIFKHFFEISYRYYLKNESERLIDFLKNNDLLEYLPKNSFSNLPMKLCKKYLDDGINHIMIGMRKTDYVDSVSSLFKPQNPLR